MEQQDQKLNELLLPPEMATQFRDSGWGAKQLAGIRIFRELEPEELAQIYSRGQILSLKPKSYAVIEGEPTRGLYIILHGTMSVYKNDPSTGAMQRLAVLEQGQNFGELSLFDQAPRSATVAAETVCHVFHLEHDAFSRLLDERGENLKYRFFKGCAEELVMRFRGLNTDYIIAQQLLWKHALELHSQPKAGSEQVDDKTTATEPQPRAA